MVIMLFYYHVGISWNILYVIPVLVIETIFSSGLVLLCSVVNVWFRDVTQALGLLTQLWMYLTPIVYPITMIPEKYRLVYALNPMVGIVEGFRSAILKGTQPDMLFLSFSIIIGLAIFVVGYLVFKKFEFSFADVI
jgi:lipopolysaccharide transport system permease protein